MMNFCRTAKLFYYKWKWNDGGQMALRTAAIYSTCGCASTNDAIRWPDCKNPILCYKKLLDAFLGPVDDEKPPEDWISAADHRSQLFKALKRKGNAGMSGAAGKAVENVPNAASLATTTGTMGKKRCIWLKHKLFVAGIENTKYVQTRDNLWPWENAKDSLQFFF